MAGWLAGLVLALGMLTFGGSPAEGVESGPRVSCAVERVEGGVVRLIDTAFETEAIVVERSVDGGPWWWRGRMEGSFASGLIFEDEVRDNTVMNYRIRPVANGTLGEPDDCGVISLREPVPTPTTCTTHVDLYGYVGVFVEAGREIYSDFVFYRTAGTDQLHWRGRSAASNQVGGINDYARPGVEHEYFVRAVAANGKRSEPISCSEPFTFEFAPPAGPSCRWIPVGFSTFQVESEGSVRIAAYRSVDGGPQYWRGIAHPIGWGEPDSAYSPGSRYDYFLQGVGPTGLRSERVYCGSLTIVETGFGLDGILSFDGPMGG